MNVTTESNLPKFPVLTAVVACILAVFLPSIIGGLVGLDESDYFGVFIRYLVSLLVIVGFVKLDWARSAGIATAFKLWRFKWFLYTLPLLLIAALNLLGIDWTQITLTPNSLLVWLTENIAVGLYEEVLLRGLVLFLLIKAWGQTASGLLKAVLFQALIFGLLHYANLSSGASVETVTIQVIYAFLIGIGFGGLALLTGSIWPGVIAHTLIDACSSIEDVFHIDGVRAIEAVTEMTFSDSLVAILLMFVLATVPGLFYTRRAQKNFELAQY